MTTFLQIDYLSEVCPFNIHQMTWYSRYQSLIRRNFGCGGYIKSLTDVTSFLEPTWRVPREKLPFMRV